MKIGPLAVLALLLGMALPVRAEHANIDLTLTRQDPNTHAQLAQVSASADQDPPPGGHLPRPLLKVKAGEPLVFQFIFVNTYPHGEVKDVTVRYFVVPESAPRQKTLPDLTKNVVTQGSFQLNFKPKTRVGAQGTFTIPRPGVYLLRVQSQNTQSDHEHFAAIDIQVE